MHARAVLRRADTCAELPRLGGMARPDGVVIISERFWAFAGRDGRLLEGAMPSPPRTLGRVPLARGLARLALSVSPLFRRGGVTRRRERRLLALALLGPFTFFLLPTPFDMIASLATAVALVAWLFRGRTLRLHGAEHRAIAAAEERRLDAAWVGEARPTRFSPRCGTNFAALVVPITVAAERVWPFQAAVWTPLVVTLVSLALTMELWRAVQESRRRGLRLLLLPGLALQRVTTREPSVEETRVALRAVSRVLERELGIAS
jgi:Protein of unknown function (DUF1385)